MSSATVYSAVRTWLEGSWNATPLAWENEPFEVPEPPSPFVVVEIYGDSYQQESIGAGNPAAELWREDGAVLLHVMVPAGTGSLTARTHAEALANLLRGLELPGGIRFRGMSIGLGETATDDGNWWRISVRAEWLRG